MSSLNVNEILENHRRYFERNITKDISFRLKQLNKLKEEIKKNEKLIVKALYKDLGKPEFESYETEIGIVYESIKFISKNLSKWSIPKKVKTPITQPLSKSYIYSEPYGTVLIIGPFNYPFQLIMEPLIGAISAGNTAVLKPSEDTPNVADVVSKIINDTFDKSYISVVRGGRQETSELINSIFDYIFFTGSIRVGKIVMEAASKNLIPVTLELGGKSPCIVDKTTNLDVSAKRIAWGKFMNTGQTCVAPDYLLVHKDVKKLFLDKLLKNIKEFYGDNPKNSKDYGKIVNIRQLNNLIGLLDKDKIILGGEYDLEKLYLSPTIMDNVTWEDKIMEDEIFGPILPIIEYEDINEIIKKINRKTKPLALYLFTEDKKIENHILENISYGGGCINDTISHLATPYLPFGGVGSSGIGAYHGKASFDLFSHKKSILKKSTKFGINFIFPPYNDKKLNLIKKVLK